MGRQSIKVTVQGVDLSRVARGHIFRHTNRPDRYDPRLISCNVTCESLPRHQRSGSRYKRRAELGVAEKTMFISPQRDKNLEAAVRDSFDEARQHEARRGHGATER